MNRIKPFIVLLFLALITNSFAGESLINAAKAIPVNLTTTDGIKIAGKYLQGPQNNSPAIILLHMMGRTMNDWDTIIPSLAVHYSILAIDFRGHGQSKTQNGYTLDYRDFTNTDWKNLINDVKAAYSYLRRLPDDSKIPISIIGASIGANIASVYAAEQPNVKALVLLSPGLNYYGIETTPALEKYNGKILIVSCEEDNYSFQSTRSLLLNKKVNIEFHECKGAYHGNRIITRYPDTKFYALEWLNANIK